MYQEINVEVGKEAEKERKKSSTEGNGKESKAISSQEKLMGKTSN